MAGHHMAQRPVVYRPAATLFGMRDLAERAYDEANEWYTPAYLCAAAREVMSGIELDPASCERANMAVQAERFFTQEQDGLARDWTCRSLWLNPPFGTSGHLWRGEDGRGAAYQGQSLAAMFVSKLTEEYRAGRVRQAILLYKADPKNRVFQKLWDLGPICLCADRIYFSRPNKPDEKIQFGTALTYMGPPEGEARFIDVFRQFGRVARAVDEPPAQPLIRNGKLWQAV